MQTSAAISRPASGRRRTQQERSEESARRLLQSAIELIAEKGYERTTVAEIGARAGYSRSMVRARYGSKEALLQSIFSSELDRRLLPPGEGPLTGVPWVLARIEHVAALLRDEPELMRAFALMSLEAGIGIAALRTWYAAWLTEFERQLAVQIGLAQRDGTVSPALDPGAEAAQFILTGLGLIFRWSLTPGYDLAAELASWRARLLRAYLTPTRAAAGRP